MGWAKRLLWVCGFLTLLTAASPAATLTGFTPDRGPTGTEVTLTGTGLGTTVQAFFGSQEAAAEVLAVGANSVRVRVPANAITGPISVFTRSSGSATTRAWFIAAPRVDEITPIVGDVGTIVTLTGANFSTGLADPLGWVTNVTFNGARALFQVNGLNQLLTQVPTNATTGPITVANAAGTYSTLVAFQVTPRVTGFSPTNGMPGDLIELQGRNLAETLRVEIGGVQAPFSGATVSNLVFAIPTNAINGVVQVTTLAGRTATSSNLVVRPRVISFTPAFGPAGTVVRLNGGGFHGLTEVWFNATKATTVQLISSMAIDATVPPGTTTGPIKVVTTNGTFITTNLNFTLPPRITTVNPTSGVRGDTVTIDGSNLNGVTRVLFNGIEAAVTATTPTRLTVTVPAAATTGRLTIESPAGNEQSTSTFTVRPVIDGFSPQSGPVGTAVQLSGSGLTNLAQVRLGDVTASATVLSSTNVRVIVPLGAFSGRFHLRTQAGQEATAPTDFLVQGATPTIASFTPTSGPPGTRVTVTGTGLRTTSRAQFNGVEAEFEILSGTEVAAIVPPTATTGSLALTTLDGIAISANPFVVGEGSVSLSIELNEVGLYLRWPATATGYTLEGTDQLGAGAQWAAVTVAPVQEAGQWRVLLPATTTGSKYYRLRK